MPVIPAICDNCGTLFNSGFYFENVRQVTLSGNKSAPCPNCGGVGSIPDGLYNFLDDSVELISGPKSSKDNLTKLVEFIKRAKDQGKDFDEIKNEFSKEFNEFKSLADFFPKNRTELYSFLTVLIMVITLVIESSKEETVIVNTGLSKPQIEQLVNTSIEESLNKSLNDIDTVATKKLSSESDSDSLETEK